MVLKAKVLDLEGKPVEEIELPPHFEEEIRPDLISRAVLAQYSHKRQPYGPDPLAGKRHVVRLKKVRRARYRTFVAVGYAYKVPRKIIARFGGGWAHFWLVGAFAPNTRGGRRAHPPKPEKIWAEEINKKERRKAIRSAIAATACRHFVLKRGHKVPDNLELPIIVVDDIEKLEKTKQVMEFLKKLGLEEELERCKEGEKKWRAGKGKRRGRRYVRKIGPLFVVSDKNVPLVKAARNIPGVDVCPVRELNAATLAPGCQPGRLTIWSKKAIEILKKENLFM